MHRLVASSKPGAVERANAVSLLTQRAVLNRAICHELSECHDTFATERTGNALGFLCRWVGENYPSSRGAEPWPKNGIDQMNVPADCGQLLREIKDGAEVCHDLFMLFTADSGLDAEHDEGRIRKGLAAYFAAHPKPAVAPWHSPC